MKNIIGAVFLIIIILGVWVIFSRNGLVEKEEFAKSQWANVESQYQRRADLIPNLVNTVKGYASHENSTLIEVINARSKAKQVTVNPDKLTAEELNNFGKAQGEIGVAIGKLLMVTESYPELKASQSFLDLQAQLEGTENRISVERMRYNKSVKLYNTSVRKFPSFIIARIFGFDNLPYFEADNGAEKASEVEF